MVDPPEPAFWKECDQPQEEQQNQAVGCGYFIPGHMIHLRIIHLVGGF
jgi:hypothetical protein